MSRRRSQSTPGPYLLSVELLRDRVTEPDRFPYTLPVIQHLIARGTLDVHPKVTFFVGENGTGKSTFLEALAVASGLNAEGGSGNFQFASRASHSRLDECLRLARAPAILRDSYFLRAETFYNVASEIERLEVGHYYGNRSLHEQSHGESFFTLFERRFGGRGLYVLDEPEAALSPNRQLAFLALMHDYCRQGSQFLIATHSPIIMAYPDAWIYLMDEQGVHLTPYEETEHFLVTRGFLANPGRTLAVLLADDPRGGSAASEEAES